MSHTNPLQPIDPPTEASDDLGQLPDQPRLTAEQALHLPALCGPQDMAAIWGVTHSQFCRLNKRGAFDFLKVDPAVGPKCFSGELIRKYLTGEPRFIATFGRRKRA